MPYFISKEGNALSLISGKTQSVPLKRILSALLVTYGLCIPVLCDRF